MTRRTTTQSALRRLVAVAGTAALLALTLPAGAASVVDVDLDRVTRSAGNVDIRVDVDVASEPIITNDSVGDGLAPSTDIASIEFELLNDRNAAFRINLASPLPVVGTTTAVMFFWEMSAGGAELQLSAMHNRYSAPGSWSFQLENCSPDPDTGTNTCTGTDVLGSYADGVIEMQVPLSSLGLGLGDTISQAGPGVYATYGAAGLIWNGVAGFDGVAYAPIQIPELRVTATNTATGSSSTVTPTRGANVDVSVPGSGGDQIQVTATFDGAADTLTVTAP